MPIGLIMRYFYKIVSFNLWWGVKDLIKAIIRYKYNEDVKIRNWARKEAIKNFWYFYKKRKIIQKNRQVDLKYLEKIIKFI